MAVLFPYPEGGAEGSLPFRFENYGTFAGPQFDSLNYNYDTASKELIWHTLVPGDFSFKNLDLGAYLFNNEINYVGFHCDSISTQMMTLEASYGNIPILNLFADNTMTPGNVVVLGSILADGNIVANGTIISNGAFTQNSTMTLSGVGDVASAINSKLPASSKGFDIPHPNKEGHRIRHICVEGPESGPIYVRGKLDGKSIIKLPDYWKGLVDEDSITVNLTPIGSFQELFVEDIQWGKNVIVKNSAGGPIKCFYQVWANRLADEKLHVEYEGQSPADYPGDNSIYSIAGYDYDKR
tara:strand:- start:693 stop:1580 length:888 start_codon:yes stop_codon:yes gene_type:complete